MKKLIDIIITLIFSLGLAFPATSFAATDELFDSIDSNIRKSAQKAFDAPDEEGIAVKGEIQIDAVFVRALQFALGVLGLIAVILLVYAGYLWMGAGGRNEQIETAKKIIKQVVIGMIIIALAYGIISFALTSFTPTGPVERT